MFPIEKFTVNYWFTFIFTEKKKRHFLNCKVGQCDEGHIVRGSAKNITGSTKNLHLKKQMVKFYNNLCDFVNLFVFY